MTREPQGPCLNCPDRTVECHSTCKEYIKYKEELRAWKKGVNNERFKALTPRAKWDEKERKEWLQNHKNRRHMY